MKTASSSTTPSKKTKPTVVDQVLTAYGLKYQRVLPQQKGYRNQSYPVVLSANSTVNLILYKSEPGILDKIHAAHVVSEHLATSELPVRVSINPKIIRLQSGDRRKYGALYNYLDGHTIPWEAYTQDHLKLLGKTMSDMHASLLDCPSDDLPDVADGYLAIVGRMRTYFGDASVQRAVTQKLQVAVRPEVFETFQQILVGSKLLSGKQALHMDFVRSNILFYDTPDAGFKVSIAGILDFEKAGYGHPLFDIARTLAFLLVDCKYKPGNKVRKYFLESGYIKRGAASLSAKRLGLLDPLLNLFLFYDFYKFLRHNPYESLANNEHFVRTRDLLLEQGLVVPTTLIARS